MMTGDLYFTQATVDLASTSHSAPGATEAYLLHQAVSDMFGQFEERPFLFRTDGARGRRRGILILSSRKPISAVDGLERTNGAVRIRGTKPFGLDVPEGTDLDFEIRLNATTDLAREGKRSKRVDVWEAAWQRDKQTTCTPEEIYTGYLRRKLEDAALVRQACVTARGFERVRRRRSGVRPITFVTVNLIGTMTVLDPGGFRDTVARGIGRSKGFGCGLLCLSRPGSVLPRRFPEIARRLYE